MLLAYVDVVVAYVEGEDEELYASRRREGLAWYINWKATPISVSSCQFSFAQERRTLFCCHLSLFFLTYLEEHHEVFGGECYNYICVTYVPKVFLRT